MSTKTVSSTAAQNNFGRLLDDVVQNEARYVIRRRNASQAILLSLSDFENLLTGQEGERQEITNLIRELSPVFDLGERLESEASK